MRFRNLILLVFIALGFSCTQNKSPKLLEYTSNYPEELQQLHRNVVNNLLGDKVDLDEVEQQLKEVRADGTWPDIDYPSKTRGFWSPRFHLSRMLLIARAYQNPETKYYQDPEVSKKIHAMLNHWLNNDYQSPNWWHPVIGTPMVLTPTLILMEPELTEEQLQKAMPILNRCDIGRTGQNKVWQSGNVLLRSLLTRDIELIKKASASIHEELVLSTNEGVQPDWSYHQHGPQLQFGNYGLSYVGDMMKWISILRGTPYKFDESKVEILRNYLLQGQQWVIWKDEMDISACGRQIGPDQPEVKAASLKRDFEGMITLDAAYAEDYKKALDYRNLSGNKHFWRSDIQIRRTPEYYFSVKMSSNRVIGAESCNSENIQGYYLGDGATYLYQSGKEYKNIFPYWNWKKIPGTTTLQDDEPLPELTASGYRIPSDFVGGVSDGSDGIAVLDYNRLGVDAKKSWFIFNNQIVCLGAGVHSSQGLPLTTSVNQSYLNGKVLVKTAEGKKDAGQFENLVDPLWILHDSIGYVFPAGGHLTLETKKVEGRWTDVTKLLSKELISADIFSLWFNHGINPVNESYAYILVPNATQKVLEEMEKNLPFQITNTTMKQEVVSADRKLSGVVFYEPGSTNLLDGIKVDQPCLLMIKKEGEEVALSVSDPTQKLSEINLEISGSYKGANIVLQEGKTNIKVVLPLNEFAGKTVKIHLKKI
ncbi:polysaccharide lyase 8 family protein [Maribellus sp. YY47]|uniref:polysaccharide lyase 8 family protein n=1 Tax=Maribellus sp. YY47 TaxID=2929486 RepID=UPI0020019758|nr:polysaccharide lyase 8 family protein [Maribellus sp. YY47]MCK3685351.1 polysaccharide lyase 8 family protein [Maribellus sp. YY47]